MKILLIEDDENKRSALESFIKSEVPGAKIEEAKSLQAGVRRARTGDYVLIILDMTLPNYDPSPDEPGGGTIHSFGGREFLKQMTRFQITTPVIVVTQFEQFGKPPTVTNLEELDKSLRRDFSRTYRGAVYYHAAIIGWQQALASLIEATIRQSETSA